MFLYIRERWITRCYIYKANIIFNMISESSYFKTFCDIKEKENLAFRNQDLGKTGAKTRKSKFY